MDKRDGSVMCRQLEVGWHGREEGGGGDASLIQKKRRRRRRRE